MLIILVKHDCLYFPFCYICILIDYSTLKIFNMKKVVISLVALAIVALTFSSCKTHERCPAYGKANTPAVKHV